jgi:hypothetical protein
MRNRALLVAILALALVAGAVDSGDAAGPLTRLATVSLGTAKAHSVVLVGDLAYVGTSTGLTIVDVANPAAPVVLGSVSTARKTLGLAIRGSYAYLAAYTGDVKVVNVANPAAPVVVKTVALPSYAWDVAIKDHIAYVATFAGEIYLLNLTNPASPVQVKVVGVPAWTSADATNLAKLNAGTTSGNAKVTGVAVAGNLLFAVDWNYGRLYMWDVADPAHPVFAGTQYIPFTFRVTADPAHDTAYTLAAFGNSSGIYSTPISSLGPSFSTSYASCGAACDYFKSTATDYGGLTVSATGRYLVYVAGKVGGLQVLDVSNPADMRDAGYFAMGTFYAKTGESLGVATSGEHIFVAAGALGFQVFSYPGLDD